MENILFSLCLNTLFLVGLLFVYFRLRHRLTDLEARLAILENDADRMELLPFALAPAAKAAAVPLIPASPAMVPEAPAAINASPAPQPTSLPAATARRLRQRWYEASPLLGWFLHRHILVQIGLLVLFIGVALLLSYAVEQGWLSLEVRHAGAAFGGIALTFVGWFVAGRRRRGYGMALQGGGLAILYLTTFSAYRLYALLPAPIAFGLFVMLGAAGFLLAVFQDARLLAYLATIGAFAAPLAASGTDGSPTVLLGYYLVVNVSTLAIGLWKRWQGLVLLGFGFTYLVGIGITFDSFEVADFALMQAFVAVFFSLYLAASVLLTARKTANQQIDGGIILAALNPIAALAWQAILVESIDRGLGYSGLVAGVVYLALFAVLSWRRMESFALLRELALFYGLFFLALAVPFFFDATITSAVWAVAGAVWVWLGVMRPARWMIAAGLVAQLGAGIAFGPTLLTALGHAFQPIGDQMLFVNTIFLGCAILGISGIAGAFFMSQVAIDRRSAPDTLLSIGAVIAFVWGALWWFGGGLLQASMAQGQTVVSTAVLFLTVSAIAMEWIGARWRFDALRIPLLLLLPALSLLALAQAVEINHPLEGGAWYAWPLALVAHGWMLQRRDKLPAIGFYHAGGAWLLAYLAALAVYRAVDGWAQGADVAGPATLTTLAAMILLLSYGPPRLPVPYRNHATVYLLWGVAPIAAAASLLAIGVNMTNRGDIAGIPYFPVVNVVGLSSAALLAALLVWLVCARNRAGIPWAKWFWSLRWGWGILLVFCISAELARIAHHLIGVPFTWSGLYNSASFQAMLAVTWGILALVLMFAGNRQRRRSLWIAGVLVLGATVIKLFLVDLVGIGTVARIVSFIGVGLLILVVAYLAPVPPRMNDKEETSITGTET